MKIKNISEVRGFLEAVDKCHGQVYLQSLDGNRYNLKSKLSQYIAIGALLSNHGEDLELFCEDRDDNINFFKFFKDYPEVI